MFQIKRYFSSYGERKVVFSLSNFLVNMKSETSKSLHQLERRLERNQAVLEKRLEVNLVVLEKRLEVNLVALEKRLEVNLVALEKRLQGNLVALEKRLVGQEKRMIEAMIANNYKQLIQTVTAIVSVLFCTLGTLACFRFDISHPHLNPSK